MESRGRLNGLFGFLCHATRFGLAWAVTLALAASGADIAWTNGAGGDFMAPGNWKPAQVPGLADNATFNLTSPVPYTVTLGESLTNSKMILYRDKLTLNLVGHSYYLTNDLSVGASTQGVSELTLTGGLFRLYGTNKNVFVGTSLGGGGELTVCGSNTVLDMADLSYLYVGYYGTAVMRVLDGATVKNVQYLGVGRANAAGPGTLVIDHAMLTNIYAGAPIGQAARALVVVTNGGLLAIGSTTWSVQGFGSTVTVVGAGSRLVSGNYLQLGTAAGGATVVAADGGRITITSLYLGYGDGASKTGAVVVTGSNSEVRLTSTLMMSGHQSLGKGGGALLDMAEGGTFYTTIAYAWSNAVITLKGGRFYGGNGALNLYQGSWLRGTGIVERAPTINAGTVSPGLPAGTLFYTNCNFTQFANGITNGTLQFTLGGTNEGQYSRLAVHGTLTLAGTCSVSLANGFVPKNGDAFDLLDWTNRLGAFGTVSLPPLPRGYWVTNELYSRGVIAARVPASGTAVVIR